MRTKLYSSEDYTPQNDQEVAMLDRIDNLVKLQMQLKRNVTLTHIEQAIRDIKDVMMPNRYRMN